MKLESITEVLFMLDASCGDCKSCLDKSEHRFVAKKGDKASFGCKWNYMNEHEREWIPVSFETSEADFQNLQQKINAIKKVHPWPKTTDSGSEIKKGFKIYQNLAREIETYARFAPKNLKLELQGYCFYCGADVPITIENNSLRVGCEDCASIMADAS